MRFIDQAWKHVDVTRRPRAPATEQPTSGPPNPAAAAEPVGPSFHAFSPHVRALIQNARLTERMRVSDLARASGIAANHLRDIEEGRAVPSGKEMDVLQHVLSIRFAAT